MISVTLHANKANGSPGETFPVGVAKTTPQTTITRDKTCIVVMTKLLLTIPIATWMIWG
jgi:hypothetical protein